MRRIIVPACLMATLAAAFALYTVKYDTRRLQRQVLKTERLLLRIENDIDVLKTERAHLARPERIEALARRQGMAPVRADQYERIGDAGSRIDRSATGRGAGTEAGQLQGGR